MAKKRAAEDPEEEAPAPEPEVEEPKADPDPDAVEAAETAEATAEAIEEAADEDPVAAPVIKKSKGKLRLVTFDEESEEYVDAEDSVRMDQLSTIFVQGEGFPVGEAIITTARPGIGDHFRVSTMTDPEGNFLSQLGMVTGPGNWTVSGSSTVTQVGEGIEGKVLIEETKPIEIEVTA